MTRANPYQARVTSRTGPRGEAPYLTMIFVTGDLALPATNQ